MPWTLIPIEYSQVWLYWASEIMYCESQASKTKAKMNKPKGRGGGRRR